MNYDDVDLSEIAEILREKGPMNQQSLCSEYNDKLNATRLRKLLESYNIMVGKDEFVIKKENRKYKISINDDFFMNKMIVHPAKIKDTEEDPIWYDLTVNSDIRLQESEEDYEIDERKCLQENINTFIKSIQDNKCVNVTYAYFKGKVELNPATLQNLIPVLTVNDNGLIYFAFQSTQQYDFIEPYGTVMPDETFFMRGTVVRHIEHSKQMDKDPFISHRRKGKSFVRCEAQTTLSRDTAHAKNHRMSEVWVQVMPQIAHLFYNDATPMIRFQRLIHEQDDGRRVVSFKYSSYDEIAPILLRYVPYIIFDAPKDLVAEEGADHNILENTKILRQRLLRDCELALRNHGLLVGPHLAGTSSGRTVMSESLHNYHFLIGGRTLEMETIKKLLDHHRIKVTDRDLYWHTAELTRYADIYEAATQTRFIALNLRYDDIETLQKQLQPNDVTIEIWDHHEFLSHSFAHRTTVLEQVADFLGHPLSREERMVIANNTNFIMGMRMAGATDVEIAEIRSRDKEAIGITDADEEEAVISVEGNAAGTSKPMQLLQIGLGNETDVSDLSNDAFEAISRRKKHILVIEAITPEFSPILDYLYLERNVELDTPIIIYQSKTLQYRKPSADTNAYPTLEYYGPKVHELHKTLVKIVSEHAGKKPTTKWSPVYSRETWQHLGKTNGYLGIDRNIRLDNREIDIHAIKDEFLKSADAILWENV